MLNFFMMITFIWSLKRLAIVSMGGNVFVFLGLGSIIVYLFQHIKLDGVKDLYVKQFQQLPNFISIAVYAFEGIGKFISIICYNNSLNCYKQESLS